MAIAIEKAVAVAIARRKYTPPQIAGMFGIDVMKVIAWIKSGELKAIDASTRRGERPRYLVDVADLETFEQARAVVPPPPRAERRKAPPRPAGYVRYFDE